MRLTNFLSSLRYVALAIPAFGLLTCLQVGCGGDEEQPDDLGQTESRQTAGHHSSSGTSGYGYGSTSGYGGYGYGGSTSGGGYGYGSSSGGSSGYGGYGYDQ